MLWPPALNAIEEVVSYGGTIVLMIYRYIRVLSPSQQQQAKWLLFGFGGMAVLLILYDLIAALVPGLGAPDSLYNLAGGTIAMLTFLLLPLSVEYPFCASGYGRLISSFVARSSIVP